MCEAVDFFKKSLAEQGLDAEVSHESDDYSHTFYVTKHTASKNITMETDIPTPHRYGGTQSLEKRVAMAARGVSKGIEKSLTETFEWNGRQVVLRPYDGAQATCGDCGASVGLPSSLTNLTHSAELSAPQPHPIEEGEVLASLDDYPHVLVKMYLLGKLQKTCTNRKV